MSNMSFVDDVMRNQAESHAVDFATILNDLSYYDKEKVIRIFLGSISSLTNEVLENEMDVVI